MAIATVDPHGRNRFVDETGARIFCIDRMTESTAVILVFSIREFVDTSKALAEERPRRGVVKALADISASAG